MPIIREAFGSGAQTANVHPMINLEPVMSEDDHTLIEYHRYGDGLIFFGGYNWANPARRTLLEYLISFIETTLEPSKALNLT